PPAASSTDGRCFDLTGLEAAVADQKQPSAKPVVKEGPGPAPKTLARAESPAKPAVPKPAESAQLTEWLSSQAIRAWAQIPPAIATFDLRPYLFVAKDRKDYFGATSILGQLASVAEK